MRGSRGDREETRYAPSSSSELVVLAGLWWPVVASADSSTSTEQTLVARMVESSRCSSRPWSICPSFLDSQVVRHQSGLRAEEAGLHEGTNTFILSASYCPSRAGSFNVGL